MSEAASTRGTGRMPPPRGVEDNPGLLEETGDPELSHEGGADRFRGQRRDVRGTGGEGGIRTPGRGISPYNRLATWPVRPLRHLSAGGTDRQTDYHVSTAGLRHSRHQRAAPASTAA